MSDRCIIESKVPSIRVRRLNGFEPRLDGDYVCYWMTAFRRTTYNFALQRAVDWSVSLRKPLLVVEAVRLHYGWASERFHRFILDGMVDNAAHFAQTSAQYFPYIEPQPRMGSGMMSTVAKKASLIVSDDFPCFFHPTMYDRIASNWPCLIELIDSNGILPMAAADKTFTVAHSYRRYMQKQVAVAMPDFPEVRPLKRLHDFDPKTLNLAHLKHWKPTDPSKLASMSLTNFAIDHEVLPTSLSGGSQAASKVLKRFITQRLASYSEARNEPSQSGSSNLSPYLHFGHMSAHEVFEALMKVEDWNPTRLGKPNGKMNGFWNISCDAEGFLDQLMTWREIGFNMSSREANYDRYESLPAWAQTTLKKHAKDRREFVYDLEQFEAASTHDELWNAAQNQLKVEGFIHNYLRMLWGKKILHWSASPQEALKIMIHLNNKYALDGRDPNSYSGIFWVLGRYDRAWGPERPIFGKIRYMTSDSTRSKFDVRPYLQRFGNPADSARRPNAIRK